MDLCCLPLTNHRGSLNRSLFFWCCSQSVRQLCHLTTENFTYQLISILLILEEGSWKACGTVQICACETLVLREIRGEERRDVLKTWQRALIGRVIHQEDNTWSEIVKCTVIQPGIPS